MEAVLTIGFIIVGFVAYHQGIKKGKQQVSEDLLWRIRKYLDDTIVGPWVAVFRQRNLNAEERSYDVDHQLLNDCAVVASQILNFRGQLTAIGIPKIVRNEEGFVRATSCEPLYGFPSPQIDKYHGSPLGYVDAFLEAFEQIPPETLTNVWLNVNSGAIALTQQSGEEYERVPISLKGKGHLG